MLRAIRALLYQMKKVSDEEMASRLSCIEIILAQDCKWRGCLGNCFCLRAHSFLTLSYEGLAEPDKQASCAKL